MRVNRLEEALRQATGQIEELQNAQRRLEAQLQKFRQDVEFRFGDRSGGAPPEPDVAEAPWRRRSRASSKAEDGRTLRSQRRSKRSGRAAAVGNDRAERPARARVARAWRARAAPARRSNSAKGHRPPHPPSGPTVVGSGVAMLDQPREQYNAALHAFKAGQYPEAETGFKAFLAANPAHRLTPDAIFYIGETYLQRSRPREAAEQYLKVTTEYSKSSRAPESMVRLGQTLAELGNSEQACATLGEFGKRYPTASASVKKLAEQRAPRIIVERAALAASRRLTSTPVRPVWARQGASDRRLRRPRFDGAAPDGGQWANGAARRGSRRRRSITGLGPRARLRRRRWARSAPAWGSAIAFFMERREAGEPPAGARPRGALSPARRSREGVGAGARHDRPSRRRSGGDGAFRLMRGSGLAGLRGMAP